MLIEKITNTVFNVLFSSCNFSTEEREHILYSLTVLISEISKMFFILLVVSFIYNGIDELIILLLTIPLRTNIGGFHMNSYLNCLIFSLIYCLTVISLTYNFHTNTYFLLILSIVCSVILYIIAPVVPSQRMTTQTLLNKNYKRNTFMITLVYISHFLIWHNYYAQHALWIIIIQTIFLLLSLGGSYVQKKNNAYYQ